MILSFGGVAGSRDGGLEYCGILGVSYSGRQQDRADFIAGLGVFAPAGEYEPEGSDNTGLGIWQGQFSKLSISNIKFTANGSHKGFTKIGDYLKLKTL